MLSRLVFSSRNFLTASKPHLIRQMVRPVSTHPDQDILITAPHLPELVEAVPGQAVEDFDPKTQSLEEFLNIRFGADMPTINDDKSPSRDVKNFPRIAQPLFPDRTRLYIIPESWFDYFYEKTGVTGPYVFTAGFLTFLLSKEYYVIEHEFFTGLSLAILTAAVIKKGGPKLREWYCTLHDEEANSWDNWQKGMVGFLNTLVESENQSQEMAKNQKILFDAKRENVKLQLEAEYRRRQMVAYNEVRNRLEYMLARQVAERQYQQSHMVNWIIDSVAKSIGAQQEKDVLQKCLTDLKQLSAKHKISLT